MSDQKSGKKLEMEHDPTLKQAAREVQAILDKYDVGGIAILHKPGFVENVIKIDPSFSCVDLNKKRELRITPPIEDPQNPNYAKKKVADTVNLFFNLKQHSLRLMQILAMGENTIRQRFNLIPKPGPPKIGLNGKN